jgi:hypothetical protein
MKGHLFESVRHCMPQKKMEEFTYHKIILDEYVDKFVSV